MPYRRETFRNRSVDVSFHKNGVLQNGGALVLDSTELTGYRARAHSEAVKSTELLDISVDPYAYFLDSTSKRDYAARLKERNLQPKGDPDRGHAFELKKHTITGKLYDVVRTTTVSGVTDIDAFHNAMILGPQADLTLSTIHGGSIRTPAPYKETGLDAFAQQAYARTAPTSVIFDASLFLGELREGLPHLVPELLKGKLNVAKSWGNDYLGVQFGWIPLLNSFQDIGRALGAATEALAHQGQRVHRRYSLPELRDAGNVTQSGSMQLNVNNGAGFSGDLAFTGPSFSTQASTTLTGLMDYQKTRSSRRWFEGEFSSFYPLGFDPTEYMNKLRLLMDFSIKPSTLWELAPWSWLVDWNLRIGDTIRANELRANDLLVMHYGYAMETSVYTTELSWRATSGPTSSSTWTNLPRKGGMFATTVYKRRLRANPYGFRVGGTGALSGNQAAILGALGLSKLK